MASFFTFLLGICARLDDLSNKFELFSSIKESNYEVIRKGRARKAGEGITVGLNVGGLILTRAGHGENPFILALKIIHLLKIEV